MILAEAPVYKLRLGRPSRLPSMFINFETDPHLCSSSQTFFSCINESESLTSNSARTSIRMSTRVSTWTSISIHHNPTLHPYPSLSNDLPPHPTSPAPCYFPQFPPDSTSDVHHMSALWVPLWAGNSADIRINEITNIWYRDEPKSITNILRPCEHLFMPENIEINISEIDS